MAVGPTRLQGAPLWRVLGGRAGHPRVSIGLQRDPAALLTTWRARCRRLPAREAQDQAGGRPRAGGRGARTLPPAAAHGGRQQRLHPGRFRRLPRPGPGAPDDDRAAAGLGRPGGPRHAAEADPNRPLPRRERPLAGGRSPGARPRLLPHRQHQARPGGRLRRQRGRPRPVPSAGGAGLVRRHARVGDRAPGQRAPSDPARLHAAGGHGGQRALFRGGPGGPAGHGVAGRDDRRARGGGHRPRDRVGEVERATTFREWRR